MILHWLPFAGRIDLRYFFKPVTGRLDRVLPALAVLAFVFGYGSVLSVIEDQSASLFLGAAVGVLWRETRPQSRSSEVPCNRTA